MIDKTMALNALRSPRARTFGQRFLLAVLAIGLVGFLVLPPLVKSVLVDQLGAALHRPVSVQSVSINPYTLSLQVDGLSIEEKGGGEVVAGFDSLYANLDAMSLLRGGLVLSEIRLEGPKLRIVRLSDHRYNFSDLIDEAMARPASELAPPASPSSPPLFSLNNIQVSGGSLAFDDRPLGSRHLIDQIKLSLPFVSSMAYATDAFVEPAFSARVNGADLQMKGRSKPFADTLESEFALELDNLELSKYLGYLPLPVPIKVESGTLDSHMKLVFRQEKGRPSTLNLSGTAALKSLRVNEASGTPLLALKRCDLSVGSAELLKRKFAIESLSLDSPEIHARVDNKGVMNWLELMPQPAAKPALDAKPSAVPEWSLGQVNVSDGALRWRDESHGKPFNASIDRFNVDLKHLAGQGEIPAEFDVSWSVNADEWLKVEAFSARGGRLHLDKRELALGDVLAKGVRILMRRAADGALDWVKPPSLRAVQASQKEDSVSTAWKLSVASYVGEDVGMRFEDAAVTPAATQVIDGMGFELKNLSTEPGQEVTLATRFKLNRRGQVAIGGTTKLFPFAADLKLDLKTVELLPLQPYFGEKLNVAVTRGQLTLDGNLKLRQGERGQTAGQAAGQTTAGEPALAGGFSGRATIGDFQSVDKASSAEFLRWKSLYFGNIDLRHGPDELSVGEVALTDFFARVIVSPQGKLNLLQVVRQDEAAAVAGEKGGATSGDASPGALAEPGADKLARAGDGQATVPLAVATPPVLPVKIGKVTLQGGSVRFTDNFVKPNYSANLKEIGGRVSGLSSAPESTAEVDLRGSYDNVAPLSITGSINPLSAKPYLDLQAEIKSVELTSLSPYSGKYAGYAIDKGKLSLFIKYKIENNLLAAENRVFIDQLTFGDPVESPDATKLPVLLAVSLLKNRNGEIDINLPISGSLDDPQFSVGGLVVQVIVNLLVKAVTSPFALLGLGSGGGGELSSIDFEYGQSVIAGPAAQTLQRLGQALLDRPALKLEIEGRVDGTQDREGLKHVRIERKVRALKREDAVSNGADSAAVAALEVSAEEYPALLERVYRAEKFPKPRNLVGLVKSLPVAEMEKLMLTNSVVDDDDLRALGERRAKAVRDWLVGHEVPAERIFLLPAKVEDTEANAGSTEKARVSRANFSLK